MTINEYIQNTRKSIGVPNKYLIEHYKRIYSIIKKYCSANLSDIELGIAYSTNKTAELFYTQKGEKFLIYDQYLGQVFNMLNRLHFNSTEPEAAEYYCFKLLAEEFQLAGDTESAAICAGAYVSKIHNFQSYKRNVNIEERLNYTLVQETFILVHELGHYLLKTKSDSEIHKKFKDAAVSLIIEKYGNVSNIDFIDSYLSDRHIALYGKKDSYKDFLNEDKIEELKKDYVKRHITDTKELVELINNNDNLIEEIICDDLAVKLILSFSEKEFGLGVEKTLDALYIGMMNLRVLGIINKQIIDFQENKSELQLYFKTSMVRLMNFRDKATYHYGLYLNDIVRGAEIQTKLTESNLHYSEFISDRVLFTITDKLKLIKFKPPKIEEDIDFDKFIQQNDLIDEILNHKI